MVKMGKVCLSSKFAFSKLIIPLSVRSYFSIKFLNYFQEQDILQPYMFMEIMIMIKALKELKTYLEMKSLPNGSRMVNMRIMLALSMSGDHWIIQLKNVHWVMLI